MATVKKLKFPRREVYPPEKPEDFLPGLTRTSEIVGGTMQWGAVGHGYGNPYDTFTIGVHEDHGHGAGLTLDIEMTREEAESTIRTLRRLLDAVGPNKDDL